MRRSPYVIKPAGNYYVELQAEEWGHFEGVRFQTPYDAIQFANIAISEEGWAAARVWEARGSRGDAGVWDSRDALAGG